MRFLNINNDDFIKDEIIHNTSFKVPPSPLNSFPVSECGGG